MEHSWRRTSFSRRCFQKAHFDVPEKSIVDEGNELFENNVLWYTCIKSSALRLYAHAQGIKKWANIL
jgi:hypothetical protein